MNNLKFGALFLLVFIMVAVVQIDLEDVEEPQKVAVSKEKLMFPKDKPEEFAKVHQMIRTKPGQDESGYPINYQFKEFEKAKARLKSEATRTPDILPWVERGPGNVGGRTRSIVIDSRDPGMNTWFAGAVGGGIWKTLDSGESWQNLTADLPNLGISSLVQSRDPEILYAGTGNAFVSRGTNGNGVWKSTDGGDSWQVLPATQTNEFRNIFRVAVNPVNENEVVVATLGRREFGFTDNRSRILRTEDGGLTWELALEKGGGRINQVLYVDGSSLLASVNGEGIMKSIDNGKSWDFIWQPSEFNFGRIELAAHGQIAYAALDGTSGEVDHIFKTTDSGNTWWDCVRLDGDDISGWLGGQGWFDNTIAINPVNPHMIIAAGQSSMIRLFTPENPIGDLFLSEFSVLADGYENYGTGIGSNGVHVDHHALIIQADTTNGTLFVLNGNDGGVSYSRDGGLTFKQTGDTFKYGFGITYETMKGYNVSQFYGGDKMNGADRYVGGTQDNGSWVSDVDPGPNSEWRDAPSGDGFEAAWNYANPNLLLESSQYNNIYRSEDGGNSWSNVSLPDVNGPFITRIENSKLKSDLVFLASNAGLLRSTDFGLSWNIIEMPSDWNFNSSLGPPIEISLASPRIVWSGEAMRDDSKICVSIDGGNSFRTVNNYSEDESGLVTGIASHPKNENTAYLLFALPSAPKILKTTDLGENWEDLSGFNEESGEMETGFPDVATYSLLVMPFNDSIIWAGTEIGLFESKDGGLSWKYAENGFPAAPIWQMQIVNDEVVVATHGRGMWTVSLEELVGYEPVASLSLPELKKNPNFGSQVSGIYKLEDPYDSARFNVINDLTGEMIISNLIEGNADPVSEPFLLELADFIEGDTIQNVTIQLIAYSHTLSFEEIARAQIFNPYKEPVVEYQNDFEDKKEDFARFGFYVTNGDSESIGSDGLNSIHRYPAGANFTTILRQPLRIDNNSTLSFDEIVLVEPGESLDPDASNFWDYVQIEGTLDEGQNWIRLDRYDSNSEAAWLNSYQSGGPGDTSMSVSKEINLTEFFPQGSVVFLRFRLVADGFVEGWGWWIDNLNVKAELTSAIPVDATSELEIDVFPNPFSEEVTIQFEIEERRNVSMKVYDLQGKIVHQWPASLKEQGLHQIVWKDAELRAGFYILNLRSGNEVVTRKLQYIPN